jgi:type I restriction enzyme M protein
MLGAIIGGSDTLATITGGIAEAYYGVPLDLKRRALAYLDNELLDIYREWEITKESGRPE